MAAEHRADLDHLVAPGVERDHLGAPARRLEGVAAEAAAEVEHPVAGDHPEPVEVGGQHGAAPLAAARAAPGQRAGRPAWPGSTRRCPWP